MKILIGILSCSRDYHCHEDLRNTWLRDVSYFPEVSFKFFMGLGCQSLSQDEEVLEAPDYYRGMKLKVKKMLEYAHENKYDFIFKCDADTYCDIPRLINSGFHFFDYVGYGGSLPNGVIVPYGGSGYWLSEKSIITLLSKSTDNGYECEDWWVSRILNANGIKPHLDSRYYSLENRSPTIGNELITSHQYSDNSEGSQKIIAPEERQSRVYKYREAAKLITEDNYVRS